MPVNKIQISPILCFLTLLVTVFSARDAHSQSLTRGMDAVVTLFGPDSTDRVADVKVIGDQNSAPNNSNWVQPFNPLLTNWTAGNLGQIYGTAIDNAGNVYFASTAMYIGWNPQRLGKSNLYTFSGRWLRLPHLRWTRRDL